MLLFFIISIAIAAGLMFTRQRRHTVALASLFYVAQAAWVVWIVTSAAGSTELSFFTFDNLGMLFHVLLAVISPVVFYQSISYLDSETLREYRFFNMALILLSVAVTGVYYANNAAVTWIFLEATTLATAALVYHRRTIKSLEATWKYIFVSSVGIAVAYLGILLLSTAVKGDGGLSYEVLRSAIMSANPLYVKLGFLFVVLGYSCKLEIFPLYTVGVDANYTSPTPASAFISTALVNAGFVAVFRIFDVVRHSQAGYWSGGVLVTAGIISVIIGAVYLRRTNNYKRFLTYSTVENMGIAVIGLGAGGVGIFAAVFHVMMHSLIKSGMFMQIAQIGRMHRTYRINRVSNYLTAYPLGGIVVLCGMIGLLAFPPSGLFVSEIMIISSLIKGGYWLVLGLFALFMCLIIYTLCRRFAGLLLKTDNSCKPDFGQISLVSTWLQLLLVGAALFFGVVQPRFLVDFINAIIM